MKVVEISANVTLVTHECHVCHVIFAMPKYLDDRAREQGEKYNGFYCPNGHAAVYKQGETARLRAELDQEQARSLALQKQNDELLTKIAKTKRRSRAGVCLECHRHFANVERHMHKKHIGDGASTKEEAAKESK